MMVYWWYVYWLYDWYRQIRCVLPMWRKHSPCSFQMLPAFGRFVIQCCTWSSLRISAVSLHWALRTNATCMNWRGPCCSLCAKISLWQCRWQGWTGHILLVGGLEHESYFSIYWESSSQLTNIFQRGWNHQPVLLYVNRIEQTQQTRAQGIKIFSQLAAMQQIAVLPWKFLTSCRKLVPSLHSTWSGLNA